MDQGAESGLTGDEQRSPLAKRIYDLRHACLSTWLNAGVPPTQVAEWAGHGVDVLLSTYAKCLVGQEELAKRKIQEALRPTARQTEGQKAIADSLRAVLAQDDNEKIIRTVREVIMALSTVG